MNAYAPQQFPQQYPPAQPQQQQPQYPGYPPAQQYPAQPQFQPPVYPQAPPQQPAVPLAQGSIDDYYNQPSVGGGPSISWSDKQGTPKPIGTTYGGIVARDVTNADIQQQTNYQTKQPEFYRDGRPKFAMKVPLKVQQSAEFPDGEATWFVKGQARDELVRAMSEVGASGGPKAGAAIVVTLVQRKPSGQGMNPSNIVQVQYQPQAGAVAASPAPAPQVQAPVQQVEQPQLPVQQFQPAPQVQPQYAQPAQPQQFQQPVQQQAQPVAPQAPADFNAEQAALLARLTGQPAA